MWFKRAFSQGLGEYPVCCAVVQSRPVLVVRLHLLVMPRVHSVPHRPLVVHGSRCRVRRPRAAVAAAELASRWDASITLLTVAEPPAVAGAYVSEAALQELRWGVEQALQALLDQGAARVRPLQPRVETRIVSGSPVASIAAEAAAGYDLVVMGSRGMGLAPADRHLLGSVAEGVLRRTRCPVLIIPDPAHMGQP